MNIGHQNTALALEGWKVAKRQRKSQGESDFLFTTAKAREKNLFTFSSPLIHIRLGTILVRCDQQELSFLQFLSIFKVVFEHRYWKFWYILKQTSVMISDAQWAKRGRESIDYDQVECF